MHAKTAAIAATGIALAATLAGCSSSSESTPAPSGSMVGGMTTCDEATITEAINAVVGTEENMKVVPPLVALKCADGWAAAEATVSNGNDDGGIVESFIFQAEGQFWIPKDKMQVCGTIPDDMTRPDDAQVPVGAWEIGCATN